ncbi:MAG: hypothetical protein ABIO70_09670 [Pseudomonadota bacterium]
MPPALAMNAAPVGFDPKSPLRVFEVEYIDRDSYHEIADAYIGKAVARRTGGVISLVPRVEDVALPGVEREVPAGDVPQLVAAVVKDWLIDLFHRAGRSIHRHYTEFSIVGKRDDELLHQCLPHGVQLPPWLAVQTVYDFADRLVPREDRTRALLLLCCPRSRYELNATAKTLLSHGVQLHGLYVCGEEPERDSRFASRRPLLGRVEGVVDDHLRVEGRDGAVEIEAGRAYLEARPENVERVIRTIEPRLADEVLGRLFRRRATASSGPDRRRRVDEVFGYLGLTRREVAPGFFVDIGKPLAAPRRFPKHEIIPKPDLIFDTGGRRTNAWNQGGLDTFGPQDQYLFSPKKLNIAVICQADAQGRVDQFLACLLHGMPDTKAAKKGFLDRFRLEQPYTKTFAARSASAADYRAACVAAVEHITDRGESWNLVLVQIDDGMDELIGGENPYLVTKAFFLARHVAVQQVELETMEQARTQLSYTVNNVGLACYAKLGGVPWLLPATDKVAHELVVGLGSFTLSTSRFGTGDRFVGVTTVFTGDGRYLLDSRTPAVPYSDYSAAMLEVLERSIKEIRVDQNSHQFRFHQSLPSRRDTCGVVSPSIALSAGAAATSTRTRAPCCCW